jgi:DNA repair protein RecO (recombination protein O)
VVGIYLRVNGLVIRSVDYKEADKILTVLTDTSGKITVKARGARRRGSRLVSASTLFAYSEMSLFESRGRYTLDEANTLELFAGLGKDIAKMAAASYFAEVLGTEAEDDRRTAPEVLRLALNCLYALSEGVCSVKKTKAAFELRYMAQSGYMPLLSKCRVCGAEPRNAGLELASGTVVCAECAEAGSPSAPLDGAALAAARYIVSCELKRLLSFSLSDEGMDMLAYACEKYLLSKMERRFKTLEFYRSIEE